MNLATQDSYDFLFVTSKNAELETLYKKKHIEVPLLTLYREYVISTVVFIAD